MSFKIKKKNLNLPELSIILPVKDQLPYLDRCLASLQKIQDTSWELIIVNDFSDAETVKYLERFPQLNIVHHQQNKGFVESCHAGVNKAIGKYILLLNSDTELIDPLSFSKMISIFKYNKSVGIVGAKLLYPNDTIQHFGLVWSNKDMNYMHFAIGKDKNDPSVCTSQTFDVVTGACFMTTKELWNRLGGFDKIYSPGYFEDSDYCLRVKELGYITVCCAEAVLYHHQSKSFTSNSSRDHIGRNHEIFKQRWVRIGKVCKYPKIGVAYITKNEEDYIEVSIKSIYPMVSKIVVVDNCSTDKTLEILEKMEDPQKKITVISRKFNNKTEQRNVYADMITKDNGYDWLWCMDGDEVFDNENLRKIEHLIFANDNVPAFCWNFIDFWQDFGHVSKGVWESFTGRKSLINLNICGKIKYMIHTLPILAENEGDISAVFCKDIYFFHYSYCRSDEKIKEKINYYLNTPSDFYEVK